jgi:NADH-quinone oxidoreductase subunit H
VTPKLRALAILVATLFLCLAGCRSPDAIPQLLTVLDVGPRTLTGGDVLEITGNGFPPRKTARVTFAGTLLRPGREAETDVTIDAEGTSTSQAKIGVAVNDAFLDALCGSAEAAIHTTFRGSVEVSFPAATPGALPITGTVRDVVLDVRPLAPKKAAVEAELAEGERVLALLGMKVADDAPPSGGLTVIEVAEDSAAAQAGLAKSDVLVSMDGVSIDAKGDVVPSGHRRFATMMVLHDNQPTPEAREIAIRGYKPWSSSDLLAVALIVGTAAGVALFFASPLARGITWMERWTARRLPAKRGGLLPWVMDRLVALARGDAAIARRDPLAQTMPWIIFLTASALCCALPFTRQLVSVEPDLGAAFVLALALALAAALASGRHDDGRWSFARSVKLAGWVLLYHLASALALAGVVAMSGSFLLADLVRAQGGEPWTWGALRTPVGFVLIALFCAPVLLDIAPPLSRLPDADAGPSSLAPRASSIAPSVHWGSLFLLSAIGVVSWLGGWAVPFVDRAAQSRSFGLSVLGAVLFLAKTWAVSLSLGLVRETVPRVRIDQAGSPFARVVLPAMTLAVAVTAGWVAWDPPTMVRRVLALVGSGLFGLLVLHVGRRLAAVIRGSGAQPHVSPFL